jgi:hypothetical protein
MRSLALILLLSTVAAADPVESYGTATIEQDDTAAARQRALDDAFRQAIDQTVGSILPAAQRASGADLIKKQILRKAKSYVLKFQVVDEGEDAGYYKVHVNAEVAVPALTADLQKLGLGNAPVATPVGTEPPPPPPEPRPQLVLLSLSSDGATTFGPSPGDGGPVAVAIRKAIEARGFAFVPAQPGDVPVQAGAQPQPAASVPLTTDQAATLARQVGAAGAVVVGIAARDGGKIRGTHQVGAELSIALEVVDAGDQTQRLLATSDQAGGYGADLPAATDMAVTTSAARIARVAGDRLEQRWPAPLASGPAGVLVHVQGVLRWPDVADLVKRLATAPGVRGVLPSSFARGQVTLAVQSSLPPASVASALAGDTVQVTGPRDVTVDLAPPPPPTPVGGH